METLWTAPAPSSGSFREGVKLETLPQRTCVLTFDYESEGADWRSCGLAFHEVMASKCTYLPALTQAMIVSAYDKVVDVGASDWLREVRADCAAHDEEPQQLKHLRVCFDDGPCYEFICRRFEVLP